MSTLQQFEYDNQVVEFKMAGGSLMINATEMANIFGKRVDHFMRSDHAKEFIKVLEITPFGGNSKPLRKDEILRTSKGTGTWMHRVLALKFAAWLSPQFELWVYATIDEFLFGNYRKIEESLRLSAERKNKMDSLRNKLIENEDFCELERLELEEKQASYRRTKENRMQLELFRTSPN